MFGDDRYVVVIPPDQTQEAGQTAMILRTADGSLVSTRQTPTMSERQTTVGRFVLAWRNEVGQGILEMLDPSESRFVWPARQFHADAKIAVLEDQLVGVYEPNGRFVLIELADGRTVVDAKLLREPSISDLYLLRSPEQYLVVVNTQGGSRNAYYGIHGAPGVQIGRAKVYGFDRQGNPLWRRPVTIEDQFLLTNQPDRLPVLLFACTKLERKATSIAQKAMVRKLSVVGVDKRTGRIIRPKEAPDATTSLRLVGDPETKKVNLQFQREVLTMKFTDQPLPPGEEIGKAKSVDALLGGLQDAVGTGGRADAVGNDSASPRKSLGGWVGR